MKVGDLVMHGGKDVGIITHLFMDGGVSVLFKNGVYDVNIIDLEVIDESHGRNNVYSIESASDAPSEAEKKIGPASSYPPLTFPE